MLIVADDLWLQIMGCIGFVMVVSMGQITAPVRKIWPSMLGCPMCFGVWAGVPWATFLLFRAQFPFWLVAIQQVVAFSCAVSLVGFACIVIGWCDVGKEE